MKKKLLALLLAAIMIVGILPTVAFAGELNTIDEVTITEVKTGNKASDCKLDVQTGNFEVVKRFVIDMSNSQLADNDVLAENTPYIVYTVLEANDGYVFKSAKYGSNYDADFTINGKPEDYSQRCFVTAELSKLPFFDSLSDPSNAKYALVGLLFTVPEGGFPEPSNDCTYTQKVTTPENGKTYGMKLNCKDKGEFTFEANGTGWNIKNSVGKYLNAANGKLVLGDTAATAWTYKSGAFSTTVKTTQKNNGYWLGFIYVPGRGTKTVTTTYYLNRVDEGSLSTYYVGAKLFEEVSGSHEYGKAFYVDATNHKYICKNCGDVKTEAHSYDETTHKCVCGAFDPDEINVKISVDVKEKTTKKYVGWGWYGSWKDVTTYTATIKTEATGVKVCKVEYQLNGSSKWIPGTIVCSDKPIDSLKVRALGSNGEWYNGEYSEVEETTTVADILETVQGGFPAANEDESFDGYWVNGKGVYLFTLEDIELGSFINIWHPDTGDNITLDSGVTADGDNWKCSTNNGGEVTLVMKDGVLTSIEISGETGSCAIINGTYAAPTEATTTVADILNTVQDGFPAANEDESFDGYWVNENEVYLFTVEGILNIWSTTTEDNIALNSGVTADGDNWKCYTYHGGEVTLVMKDAVLTSIEISGETGSYTSINGTYTAPAAE